MPARIEPSKAVPQILDLAWRAWDLGDGDGLLALLSQARALGPLDLAIASWMDEAEAVAREQADIARYQRTRTFLREGDLDQGLRTWLGLSASARAAVRRDFDLPEFAWLDDLDALRVDAVLALGRARAALTRGDVAGARALLEPHRRLLEGLTDGREALDTSRPSSPAAPAETDAHVARTPTTAPPARPDSLAALASHMASGGAFRVQAPSANWTLVLALALRELLPGTDTDGDLDRIQRVIDGRDAWKGLPANVAVRLIELIAARLRAIQVTGVADRRIDLGFSSITAWSKKEKPGFAYGLMRDHRPRTGSWEQDVDAAVDDLYDALPPTEPSPKMGRGLAALEALVAELGTCAPELRDAVRAQVRAEVSALLAEGVSARHRRLVRIVAPVADELTSPEMRALRRAARVAAAETAEEPEDGETEEGPIPDDWPWWSATRGRRAVMVGGDPREPNRVRLERAFAFGELAWEQAEHSRNSLQKVRDRVRSGGVDLVMILTRFVGHDADQVILPACKDAGVPFVAVKSGYGVTGIRRAIERYVHAPEASRVDGS